MLTAEEKVLLQDYKKAFKNYYKNKDVVNLDKKFVGKAEYFLVRLSEVLPEIDLPVPPTNRANFTILYVSEGGGEHTVSTITFEMKARTLIVIPAYTVYSAAFA